LADLRSGRVAKGEAEASTFTDPHKGPVNWEPFRGALADQTGAPPCTTQPPDGSVGNRRRHQPQPSRGPIERQCPIRFVSVHLLGTAGQLLRVLFLDREGHISAQPHFVPREVALILAANQQRVLGP